MAISIPRCWRLLPFLLVILLGGCGQRPSGSSPDARDNPQRVLVKIGDEDLTAGQFHAFLEEHFPESSNPIPRNDQVLSELLDRAINERLLIQAARQKNIQVSDADVQEYLTNSSLIQNLDRSKWTPEERRRRTERAREILMEDRFLQTISAGEKPVTPAEVQQYYQSHPGMFQEPDRYHIEEILVKDEPVAEAVEELLAKRKSFESLAQKYSRNPVASKGGDLGWFARGELPEQFEKAVMSLKPGQHTAVIRTDYGYHIFKLKEIRKGHVIPLPLARKQIEKILNDEKKKEAFVQEITRLRASVPIKIQTQNLGFNYIAERTAN